jgi:periplasmic divalent cation tolerance protein
MEAEFFSVYITTGSRAEAEKIASTIVDEKLAACATILNGATSVYRWKGNVERADECVMFVKARATAFEGLKKRVEELHSYECPCIVALPIVAANAAYLEWLRDAT